jgi:hypothetical protein
MKFLRTFLSLPFAVLGAAFFVVAEVIRGEKMTYRKKEVIADFIKKHSLWEVD